MLKCSRCGDLKPVSRYSKNPLRPRGYNYDCNDCRAINRRHKYYSDLEGTRAKNREYYASNPERFRAANARHKAANKERLVARRKELREANLPEYNRKHREYVKSRRAQRREYEQRRRKTDPNWHILSRLRGRIRGAVYHRGVKKCATTLELLGCSIEFLKAHIESLFKPGMTWENRHLWHIDHKRPCALFDFLDPEQQRACFHYTNLQPLWYWENQAKRDRLEVA